MWERPPEGRKDELLLPGHQCDSLPLPSLFGSHCPKIDTHGGDWIGMWHTRAFLQLQTNSCFQSALLTFITVFLLLGTSKGTSLLRQSSLVFLLLAYV